MDVSRSHTWSVIIRGHDSSVLLQEDVPGPWIKVTNSYADKILQLAEKIASGDIPQTKVFGTIPVSVGLRGQAHVVKCNMGLSCEAMAHLCGIKTSRLHSMLFKKNYRATAGDINALQNFVNANLKPSSVFGES